MNDRGRETPGRTSSGDPLERVSRARAGHDGLATFVALVVFVARRIKLKRVP
jgi:hypothetical protein